MGTIFLTQKHFPKNQILKKNFVLKFFLIGQPWIKPDREFCRMSLILTVFIWLNLAMAITKFSFKFGISDPSSIKIISIIEPSEVVTIEYIVRQRVTQCSL